MPPLENNGERPPQMVPTTLGVSEENPLENEAATKRMNAVDQFLVMENHLTELSLKSPLDDGIVEPKTGLKFPMFLSCDKYQKHGSSSGWQELAGVGERSISIIMLKTIKIYAFGFYIKPDCLKACLGKKYGIVPLAELKHKASFYDDLLSHELEMTVRLMVYYKGLNMNMVRSAFETSLKNRLKKIKGTGDDEGLHIFSSYFTDQLSLSRGSIIDFHWHPGGQLRTEIEGREVGTIFSLNFCKAFFDLYIGDPPVSLRAKQEIGENLGRMLRTS